MATAIGYVRVSTAGQAADGVSMAAQRGRIEAWCKANGYGLEAVHVDAGLSGKRADNRPGLQKALKSACADRGVALVVYSLSRLARSTRDAISIAERLDKAGCDLVSLSERIDTSSAAGKMVFRMLAVLAEFERDLVSERTATALRHKASKGERISRYIPFGYDLAGDGVRLVKNVREQQVIQLMGQLRDKGFGLRAIARELTAKGVPTKQGATTWSHKQIAAILARQAA